MIDFHTHILPRIDDGSRSTEESLEMLFTEYEQGVDQVVLSPHFYAGKDSVEAFLKRRQESYHRLVEKAEEKQGTLPKLFCGAEVNYFPGMGSAEMVRKLCIGDSKILLLEMPFCQWDRSVLTDINQLIKKQGLTLIIAHIERYYPFQKNKEFWHLVFSLPVYAQINAGSFLSWKRRRMVLKFLKEDYSVLLGTDCHNMENRTPNMKDARTLIEKKMGLAYLQEMDEIAEGILQ